MVGRGKDEVRNLAGALEGRIPANWLLPCGICSRLKQLGNVYVARKVGFFHIVLTQLLEATVAFSSLTFHCK